jgi:hypothetical protein
MTQQPTQHRKSSGQFSWVWMVATFVVVGAFMYWLAVTAEPSGPRVVEEDDAAGADVAAATVALEDLIAGVGNYVGTDVRLEGIPVVSRLGTQAFWTATSTGTPFLIRFTPEALAEGVTVDGSQALTVVGRVFLMSDSVIVSWEQDGVISGAGDRAQAEFATAFLEAKVVEAGAPAGAPRS